MNFTDIERRSATILSSLPRTKSLLKYFYKRFNYVTYAYVLNKKEKSNKAIPLGIDDGGFFFGYYGKRQINRGGKFLVCSSDLKKKMPGPGDVLDLYVGEVGRNRLCKFASSRSWNWQQGCILQWLGDGERDVVIYNDFKDGKFVSKLRDVQNETKYELDLPVYAVSDSGKFALTLDFSRLYSLNPAYGYCNAPYYKLRKSAPEDDGIWYLELESGHSELILSFKSLSEFSPKPSMRSAFHKVNHIEISPDGKRFMFIHRWGDKKRKHSRLMTSNIDGTMLYILANDDMVSHCAWKNGNQVLAWARKKDLGDKYYLFHDRSSQFSTVGEGILTQDGHPSFSPNGRLILTDTYPDRLRMRSLILYDTEQRNKIILGRFFAPLKYDGDMRCDLHPRWSCDGRIISFDSCHEGVRNSYMLPMDQLYSS